MKLLSGSLVAVSALLLTAPVPAAPPDQAQLSAAEITTEEFMIPSADAGIQLYVRNKHPKGLTKFSAERTLLYVHGSTYPSETAFDLPLDDLSWMDFIARHGWDVYLVDVRGYGRSTRPPEMDEPADKNPPIVRTTTAVKDVGSAVDFILQRRKTEQLCLLGWSWGTTMMGWYAASHPARVHKLVVYAPQWLRDAPTLIGGDGPLGAYRTASRDAARGRWLTGVAEDKKADLIPAGWFEKWADATFATDPVGAMQTPPVLRAPNGTIADTREFWSQGKPVFDPRQIKCPVLLIHAEWDADNPAALARAYFAKLTGAPYRRFVEIGEGTHTVLLEKNRLQLFRETQLFLDEPWPAKGR